VLSRESKYDGKAALKEYFLIFMYFNFNGAKISVCFVFGAKITGSKPLVPNFRLSQSLVTCMLKNENGKISIDLSILSELNFI